MTGIFLNEKIKNVYFNFDFSIVHFVSNEINPGARKLILIFNFHDWMKIKWTKGTRTEQVVVSTSVHFLKTEKYLNLLAFGKIHVL